MVAVSYLLQHHTLLQNPIDTLLQNAKKVYYKMLQPFYCKMQQLYFKMGLRHRCFPVNFDRFLRTSSLQNTSRRLLSQVSISIYLCF